MNHKAELINFESLGSIMTELRSQKRWKELLLVAVATYTGCRPGDWTKFKWSVFFNQDGTVKYEATITENKPARLAASRGKKAPTRKIFILPQFREILVDCWNGIGQPYLTADMFRSDFGPRSTKGGISTNAANSRLKALATEFNLNETITNYSFRKTGARKIYDSQADNPLMAQRLAQKFLNHKSPETTMHYIGLSDGETLEAFKHLNF